MKLNLAFEFTTIEEARAVISQFVNVDGPAADKIIADAVMAADARQKEIEDNQPETVFNERGAFEWPDSLAASPASEAEFVLKKALSMLQDQEGTQAVVDLLARYGHQKVSDVQNAAHFDIIYKDVMAQF